MEPRPEGASAVPFGWGWVSGVDDALSLSGALKMEEENFDFTFVDSEQPSPPPLTERIRHAASLAWKWFMSRSRHEKTLFAFVVILIFLRLFVANIFPDAVSLLITWILACAGIVLFWVIILAIVGFYFLPWIVAQRRKHPAISSIALINFIFGWTLLGWIVALVGRLVQLMLINITDRKRPSTGGWRTLRFVPPPLPGDGFPLEERQ